MTKYIYLDESIINQEWFKHPPTVQVFLYLLFNASEEEHEEQGQMLQRGQVLVSRSKLARDLGLTERQVRTALSKLTKSWSATNTKSWSMTKAATKAATNTKTIITICDYDSYKGEKLVGDQGSDQGSDQHKKLVGDQEKELKKANLNVVEKKEETVDIPAGKITPSYQIITDYFNNAVSNCNVPKIRNINEARKKSIKARLGEYDIETILNVIDKVVASDFLNGSSNTGFTASFDWIFKPSNFIKILEGNYDNRDRERNVQDDFRNNRNLCAAVKAVNRIDEEASNATKFDNDTDIW